MEQAQEQSVLNQILSLLQNYTPTGYINSDEAAKYLGTNVNTLKEWTRTKGIPYHKPGKDRLYKVSELDRWMAKHEKKRVKL